MVMETNIYKQALALLDDHESVGIHSIYEDGNSCKNMSDNGSRLPLPKKAVFASGSEGYDDLIYRMSSESYRFEGGIIRSLGEPLETVELYNKKPRLIVLGGGHIALPLVKIGKLLGFKVAVCDDRLAFASPARFPEADYVITDDFKKAIDSLDVKANDFITVVTRGHKHDADCLRAILAKQMPRYLGMIGSRRRVAIVKQNLLDEGYNKADIDSIHSPIGLKIGAITPEEISISIMAEIIAVRRKTASNHSSYIQGMDDDILHFLADPQNEAEALLTIISSYGSVPRDAGAKMAISYSGQSYGSIGGGCSESAVLDKARMRIRKGGWEKVEIDLADHAEDDGMVCGGGLVVLIEALSFS